MFYIYTNREEDEDGGGGQDVSALNAQSWEDAEREVESIIVQDDYPLNVEEYENVTSIHDVEDGVEDARTDIVWILKVEDHRVFDVEALKKRVVDTVRERLKIQRDSALS